MSTAEQPDALARRIEQLAAASDDRGSDADLGAAVEGLRRELAAVRSELAERVDTVAAEVSHATSTALDRDARAEQAASAALEDTRGSLEARLAVLEDALDALAERLEALARDGASTTTALLQSVGDTVRSVDRRLAREGDLAQSLVDRVRALDDARAPVLEDAVVSRLTATLAARDEALHEQVRAALSASTRDLRAPVLDALAELTSGVTRAASVSEAREAQLERLAAAHDELERTVSQLRDGFVATTAQVVDELRAAAREQAEATAGRLRDLDDQVQTRLAEVRDGVDERAEQLMATLTRGLTEIADEIDVAATTTRDASERVTVLAEVTEAQRAEVAGLVQGVRDDVVDTGRALRDELLARTAEQLAALHERLDQLQAAVGAGAAGVGERLGVVDLRVAQAAGSVDRVLAGLEEVVAASERLSGSVEGFRVEWPTRTYEVVQGARAVAEAVVLDVRQEVDARLQDVRAVLERVADSVADARSGLDDGTGRLARAGQVLVAYLEQRDRLLEAERDRVISDVLDAFAAGLSARERSALAGRVNDAVARRRDARDAERYREALGEPVAPTAELPPEVLRLAASGADEERDGGAPADLAGGTPPAEPDVPAGGPSGGRSGGPGPTSTAAGQGPGAQPDPDAGTRLAAGADPQPGPGVAGGGDRRPSAPRPALARNGGAGAAVVPGPGRGAGTDETRTSGAPRSSGASAGGRSATTRPAPGRVAGASGGGRPVTGGGTSRSRAAAGRGTGGRGRLEAMPQAPNVDVALDAAAPGPADRTTPAASPGGRPSGDGGPPAAND